MKMPKLTGEQLMELHKTFMKHHKCVCPKKKPGFRPPTEEEQNRANFIHAERRLFICRNAVRD